MLQELLQKLERELEYVVGGGATLALSAEKACMNDRHLSEIECLTQPTNQRVHLRKDAMGVINVVSRLINALMPINKLPPEILGMIPMYGDRTPKDLVAVSSVCSYWRNTFIATPSLWTTLDGKGLEKSRAWVERSGTLPIQLLAPGSPNPEVLEFLAPHYQRLGTVHLPELAVREEGAVSILPKLLRPGPLLRHICVVIHSFEGLDVPVSMTGEFTSLEDLRVSGFPTSIANLRTPNLRNLKLDGAFDLINLLDLLESSPLLERLTFDLVSPRDDVGVVHSIVESVTTGRKVTLEKLKQAGFLCEGFKILQHLLLPTSNAIEIEMPPHYGDDAVNGYSQLLSHLPMFHQVRSIEFDIRGFLDQSASLEGPNGTLKLLTNDIDDPTTSINFLRLLTQYSTNFIQKLRIPNLYLSPIDFDHVSGFLKSLENLHSIHLEQSATQCLLPLGTSHCLRLKDIYVWDSSPTLLQCGRLKEFFQDRSEAGIPIRRLFIVRNPNTVIDPEAVETLREYVEVYIRYA